MMMYFYLEISNIQSSFQNNAVLLSFITLCVVVQTIRIKNMTNHLLPLFFNDGKVLLYGV